MRHRPLLPILLLLAACGGSASPSSGRVEVVAAAYPFAWLAQQVGGQDVQLRDLVKPGAEPHDIELSPSQVGLVQEAALVIYLKDFQPALDDALDGGGQGLDLGTVTDRKGNDPHIWLDPVRMQVAATALGERLAEVDGAHAAGYRTRAATVVGELKALDATFRTALTGCARRDLVTAHSAFGYLAERYSLVQRGIGGLSPDAEPSPRRVAEVARFARANKVTTIFFESLVDPKVARTIAAEIGAKTALLDPVENVVGDDDYLTVQRRNAVALHEALGCA